MRSVLKKRLQVILIVLALLISPATAFAAAVGHGAPAISEGMFESGNFRFSGKRGAAC